MLDFTIGREKELAKIDEYIKKGNGCFILAPAGTGKSHLLKKIKKKYRRRAIYIPYSNAVKDSITSIIRHLDEEVREQAIKDQVSIERVKIKSRSIKQYLFWLKDLLEPELNKKKSKPIIIFDHFEKATPGLRPLFDLLDQKAILIFSATEIKTKEKYISRAWWGLPRLYLPGLSNKDSAELLWRLVNRNKIKDNVRAEKYILKIAKGRPLAIEKLADKLKSGFSLYKISQDSYEGTQEKKNMTLFVVCGVLFVVYLGTSHFAWVWLV